MATTEKIKEAIEKYFDITILISKSNSQGAMAGKALLFSLKKLNKNATLLEVENASQEITPKKITKEPQADFLISIKEGGNKLSQLFYEKTRTGGLDLFLKTDGKELKKDDIVLKPLKQRQFLITIGIDSYEEIPLGLREKPSFILNIDSQSINQSFGDINIIDQDKSLLEIIFEIIKALSNNIFEKELQENCKSEALLFEKALENLQFKPRPSLLFSSLSHGDIVKAAAQPKDIKFSLEKLCSGVFPFQNFLLLWEQNSSPLSIRGVFYSPDNQENINKIANRFISQTKYNSVIFNTKEREIRSVEEQIISLLN
ncbi:MAG: hypothetical protein Q7R99_04175 [bacterium]|nr:hypothetical protein [bacterium]